MKELKKESLVKRQEKQRSHKRSSHKSKGAEIRFKHHNGSSWRSIQNFSNEPYKNLHYTQSNPNGCGWFSALSLSKFVCPGQHGRPIHIMNSLIIKLNKNYISWFSWHKAMLGLSNFLWKERNQVYMLFTSLHSVCLLDSKWNLHFSAKNSSIKTFIECVIFNNHL